MLLLLSNMCCQFAKYAVVFLVGENYSLDGEMQCNTHKFRIFPFHIFSLSLFPFLTLSLSFCLSLPLALPPSPSNKPHLFAPQVAIGAGIYTVDPGTTPTTPPADHVGSTSGEEEEVMRRPLTSFIVRVVHEATNRIAFFWLVS